MEIGRARPIRLTSYFVFFLVLMTTRLAHSDVCSVRTDFAHSDDSARAIAVQSDGKILVAGSAADTYAAEKFAIVRYNTDGSLDPSFGGDGKVVTDLGGNSSDIWDLAIQTDGKIVAAGIYEATDYNVSVAVARYNTDGSLDTSFGTNGITISDVSGYEWGFAVALQADGKIVVAGKGGANRIDGNPDFFVARYTTGGVLDATFDGDGWTTTAFGGNYEGAYDVQIQTDGKIVLAGWTGTAIGLVRYNTDGSEDGTFGKSGKVNEPIGTDDGANGLVILSDGKLVVGGYANASQVALARYTTAGDLDTTFDGDGFVTATFPAVREGSALVRHSDGTYILSGGTSMLPGVFGAMRFNADGSVDTGFGDSGLAATNYHDYNRNSYSVAVQTDGKVLVTGKVELGFRDNDFMTVRYDTDGSLDTSFGGDGIVVTDLFDTDDASFGAVIDNADRLVQVGYTDDGGGENSALARYWLTGAADTSFDTDGLLVSSVSADADRAYAVAVQTDNKIVTAGASDNGTDMEFYVARYLNGGTADSGFSGDGIATTDVAAGFDDEARAVVVQADGKVVAAGWASDGTDTNVALVRYDGNGNLDSGFDSDGVVVTPLSATDDAAYGMALQTDGKIVVVGYANVGGNDDFAVVRYDTDGSLDTTFDSDGIVTTDVAGGQADVAYDVVIQSDGKIVVAGRAGSDFAVIRYSSGGGLDASFGASGVRTVDIAGGADEARSLALQVDGKIVAAGTAVVSGGDDIAVIRLDTNGDLDTAFDGDGIVTEDVEGRSDFAADVLMLPGDEILISGTTTVGTSSDWFSFRLNPDGSPDTTCTPRTTAVDLVTFDAHGLDGQVELRWETGSEIDNLGFHLYRSSSELGPYERITATAIPGLGSNPQGATYGYRDKDLENGRTYYYKLEDIEVTGRTETHGPVSATPRPGAADDEGDDSTEDAVGSRIRVGDPTSSSLRVLERRPEEWVLELETGGFYAEPQGDGTVRLAIPGFDETSEKGRPSLPIRRTWVDAVAGRQVHLISVDSELEEYYDGLIPAAGTFRVEADSNGNTRLVRRRRPRSEETARMSVYVYPERAASLVSVGYQGDVKKALVEWAPLRWDGARRRLVLAHRIVIRVRFQGRDEADRIRHGRRLQRDRRRTIPGSRRVAARLVTKERGLYRVSFEDIFGPQSIPAISTSSLRLSRLGNDVAFHVEPGAGDPHSPTAAKREPSTELVGPGSLLYFWSEGAESNPYDDVAVYELEIGRAGRTMPIRSAAPNGTTTRLYWQSVEQEENLLYQSTLVDAPDRWLWSSLFAPTKGSFPFAASAIAGAAESSELEVWLQGASDFDVDPDHHVRLYVNGTLVGEASWDGQRAKKIDVPVLPGALQEGTNLLEIENVGDTRARYSMVMLDRFRLRYPRLPYADEGWLEGRWSETGTVHALGLGPGTVVLETGESGPVWLDGAEATEDGVAFRTEAGRTYVAVAPEAVRAVQGIRRPLKTDLANAETQADYLVLGSRPFLDAAAPLLELRRRQGLRVKPVRLEEVYSSFGFGEPRPEAIRDFLAYAYHNWKHAPRYVLLLGDATLDFKDRFGTGVTNQLPTPTVMTRYMETPSDPSYAMVNGEDRLPDFAIGRLPGADIDEIRRMVSKIVIWETSGQSLEGRAVFVADNPDRAGDFVAEADSLADAFSNGTEYQKIYLSELGTEATRAAVLQAFDDGASLMSYLGHGGIHLWADENILNIGDVPNLHPQPAQPLLLTLNCLNGYFYFPFFDSLAEALLKAEDKGVIAAVSPSGLSLDFAANQYHRDLLQAILEGGHERLGDAMLSAQSAYAATGAWPELLTISHLFGDPAMRLQ